MGPRLAFGIVVLAALPARAADPALLGKESGVTPSREVVEARILEDVVVAPIPVSNPTLGTGLAKLLRDDSLRESLAAHAKDQVRREFTPEAAARKLADFYSAIEARSSKTRA